MTMGTGKTIQSFQISDVSGGCNYSDDLLAVAKNQSPNALNVEFFNGRWRKRKGYTHINTTVSATAEGYSLIDFGNIQATHKQVAHFGDTVYSFTNLLAAASTIRTGAPREKSYNARVGAYLVQTYDDHSAEYYWDGIAASMSAVSVNAPGFKRCIEFQGYLLGFNTAANPMRAYYQSTGNFIGAGAAYTDYFTLTPAPNDDEITDPFLLNGRLYVGTKYSIFRVSFVGGVTVFEFKQVVSDVGIVPNTTQLVVTKEYGQVAIFMGYDKRLYMFDGANLRSISDLYYYHNKDTMIAMDLIDDNYKENAFAVYDSRLRLYRLFVTRKAGTRNGYCINVDIDTFAYYPFDNMVFSSGAMCYDAILRPTLVCADYAGVLHRLFIDTNTDDGADINEYYTSPLVIAKGPFVKQGQAINITMAPLGAPDMLVYDRVDFARAWTLKQRLPTSSPRDKHLGTSFVLGSAVLGSEKDVVHSAISLNNTFNYYQFKLVLSDANAPAWEIYDMNVNQSVFMFGRAEPQR
jgi:hypothetical protein